jgi:outer membrane lipoprotein-sorting protein
MFHRNSLFLVAILLLSILLWGCPKKIVKIPPVETPRVKNPVAMLLEAFSDAENFESRASIRIDTVKDDKEMNLLLNGYVLFQKPDKLRVLGYHPLGMGLFDALYLNGHFFLLSPLEKRAYTGQVSDFEELIEKVGIQISTEKTMGSRIPTIIRIGVEEKKTRIDLKLKEISMNGSLPEDAFQWFIPEGVDVRSLAQLIRDKKL